MQDDLTYATPMVHVLGSIAQELGMKVHIL